ncbi:MAG TPA: DNA alkylation repair protein [Phenylobacterium sp.]|jgi:3-methyladenine DNA glycosylase AlkD|nr:DNA alkylation repair protein [Phenylobacterium sp.]
MDAAAAIAREIDALPRRDTASVRAVRKRWSATLRSAPAAEVLAIAVALEAQAAQTGKWVAYELVRFHPAAFAAISETQIAEFAGRAQSWYAVDALGTILTGPLWAKGRLPDGLIEDWSRSGDRWLRRSALVATVGLNARASGGAGDAARTLAICRGLASDRDDMVEKALSWALRFLSQRDRPAVERFMAEMGDRLPARARREVRHKLTTGLKSRRTGQKVTTD